MTASETLARLAADGRTLAVAESLTGGLLTDAFVRVPGASAVLAGAVVAYATPLKASMLGVDPTLLVERGAVDPGVARAMADGVRFACAIDTRPADIGVATTGVAGPDPQDGQAPGTVFAAVSDGGRTAVAAGSFEGDRAAVRAAAVGLALDLLAAVLSDAAE